MVEVDETFGIQIQERAVRFQESFHKARFRQFLEIALFQGYDVPDGNVDALVRFGQA